MKASQTIVEIPRPLALIPLPAHGDTAENPRPKPSTTRISDSAAAAAAPAKIAAQDTPDSALDAGRSAGYISEVLFIVVVLQA
ncbi:hypothetical protein D3C81_1694550 [compost metagenome]